MTQQEMNQFIRDTFKEHYFEIGIYRWANDNKQEIKAFFLASFVMCIIMSYLVSSWAIAIWSFLFIGIITIVGLEHLLIGLVFKRIIKKIEEKGIHCTLPYLLYVCADLLE